MLEVSEIVNILVGPDAKAKTTPIRLDHDGVNSGRRLGPHVGSGPPHASDQTQAQPLRRVFIAISGPVVLLALFADTDSMQHLFKGRYITCTCRRELFRRT